MATFRDLLSQTKSQITEIEPSEAEALRGAPATVFLDVREPDEFEQGALAGVLHIPRGHLEAQIEGRITDKSMPVIVYCAGGVRSAFAAKTLAIPELRSSAMSSAVSVPLLEHAAAMLHRMREDGAFGVRQRQFAELHVRHPAGGSASPRP